MGAGPGVAVANTTCIAVIYHSVTGSVRDLAEGLADGARSAGAEVRLRYVSEHPGGEGHDDADDGDVRRWNRERATLDDVRWAHGFAFGSPTRFGLPAAPLKAFLDSCGELWSRGSLVDKAGAAFTSSSTDHGGVEATIMAINNVFYHWGSVIVPAGYAIRELRRDANPFGASWVSHGGARPNENALRLARAHGARLAEVASRLTLAAAK